MVARKAAQQSQPRHRKVVAQPPLTARLARAAAPVLAVAVLSTSAVAAVWTEPTRVEAEVAAAGIAAGTARDTASPSQQVYSGRHARAVRELAVSRSESRLPEATSTPTPEPKPKPRDEPKPEKKPKPEPAPVVVGHRFLTTALNVWSGPGETHTLLDVLPTGTRVAITGEVDGAGAWAQVVLGDEVRWVNAAYLADEKPRPQPEPTKTPEPEPTETPEPKPKPEPAPSDDGLSTAPCPSGSSVEDGLSGNAVAVHRAVCGQFPDVPSYGGYRSDSGSHGEGRALDVMIASSSQGDAIAEWVRAHAADLGVSEVIWAQHIWTVERSSEGWRPMEDRGSATANHYDHVHVTVY